MKLHESLASIPVKVAYAPAPEYHRKRRITQLATLLLIVLIPLVGLFRIDLQAGNFVVLGRQIWWSDYSLMLGFWVMLATGAAMTYSTIGTVWCGWACPQNSLSEWVNHLTYKLLGKRAHITVESGKSKIAAAKNNPLNWLALGLIVLAISSVLALIPFLYFYPPDAVWSMLTFKPDERLPRFTHYLYLVVVLAIFLDIALIRNVLCSYFCLYRIWQHIFKTKQTLHVGYDADRAHDCVKCNYCKTSCFLDFDPTQFKTYDSCINCGDCIDACNRLHAPDGSRGLLQFEFGEKRYANGWRDSVDKLVSRLGWAGAIFLIGGGLFAWGFLHYSPYNIVAYRSEKSSGISVSDYQIQVSNKMYTPAQLALSVKGLPEGSYKIETENIAMTPASRTNFNLHISPDLPKGLHQVIIEARAPDGWVGRFGLEHYSARN
jgi:polyferredoxin